MYSAYFYLPYNLINDSVIFLSCSRTDLCHEEKISLKHEYIP